MFFFPLFLWQLSNRKSKVKVQPDSKIEDVAAASSVGFWIPSLVVLFCPPPSHVCVPFILANICSLMFPREEVWFVFVEQDTMYLYS